MYLREKKAKILIFMILTLGMLFLWAEVHKKEADFMPNANLVAELENSEAPAIAVYYPLSGKIANATDFYVRWWHQEVNDKYYLFLPSGIKAKDIYWIFQTDTNVWIGQQKIENKDRFCLGSGSYEVEVEKNGQRQRMSLEVMQSGSIPSLFVETQSGSLQYIHAEKGNYESGKYTILDENGKIRHAGNLEKIRGRGNASWADTNKKSYQITLETKTSILSMPEEKQWVLTPNFADATLLKNKICNDLVNELEMPFTPEMEYVDLYVNGEYRGNYLLMEKIEVGENRVAIRDLEKEMEMMNEQPLEELERFEIALETPRSYKGIYIPNQPKDISGGYLLEIELTVRYQEEVSGFVTGLRQGVVIKSPKYASFEQVNYIKDLYQEMEDAVFSDTGVHPVTGRHYSDYLDVDSAIKKYIVEEISKNLDTGLTSQYLYKPDNGVSEKFYLGPMWDFDKSLGIDHINYADVDLSVPEYIHAGSYIRESHLLYALYQKEEFRNSLIDVFATKARPIMEKEVEEVIPYTQERIYDSCKMNLIRWNCYGDIPLEEKLKCYEEEVENIRNFIRKRVEFLETEWGIE